MGEAMIAAILDRVLSTPPDICVSDTKEPRRQHLARRYGVAVSDSNRLTVEKGEIVVLAIKPQDLGGVMAELKDRLKPFQLVMSIIAGASIKILSRGLGHDSVVRVMPNTPAQIGLGMSVWTATAGVSRRQKKWTSSILSAMGREIYVDDEKYIDMATAVSGSGPAYLFLFVEHLVEAGVNIGLPRDMAQELVLQTVLGSSQYLQKSGRSPGELRRMVTSPGGTTAEALAEFEKGQFSGLVTKAVSAAYERARNMSKP